MTHPTEALPPLPAVPVGALSGGEIALLRAWAQDYALASLAQPSAPATAAPEASDRLRIALDALDEIALAGMSGTGQESEDGMRAWHAQQAWEFIGIAARAKSAIAAQAAPVPTVQPLTEAQIEKLREATFSTGNPFCPCDSKTMRKAVRAAERACAAAWGITLAGIPTAAQPTKE